MLYWNQQSNFFFFLIFTRKNEFNKKKGTTTMVFNETRKDLLRVLNRPTLFYVSFITSFTSKSFKSLSTRSYLSPSLPPPLSRSLSLSFFLFLFLLLFFLPSFSFVRFYTKLFDSVFDKLKQFFYPFLLITPRVLISFKIIWNRFSTVDTVVRRFPITLSFKLSTRFLRRTNRI